MFPEEWQAVNEANTKSVIYEVSQNSSEFKRIAKKFDKAGITIWQVKRIQNESAYKQYVFEKESDWFQTTY